MFIKHLTNKEYQKYSNTSLDNKDPNGFTDYYLVRISNDEERIVSKKDLEKIRKRERKISKKRFKESERLQKEYMKNIEKMQELREKQAQNVIDTMKLINT